MKIADNIRDELNKISGMDKDKKKDYFKTYYLKPTIIIFVCLLMLVWFIKDTVFQPKGVCMGCAYGVEISDEQKEQLTSGYLQYYGYNTKKYRAFLSTDNMFEGTAQQMDANSHEMALFAQIAAGEIHYLILDKYNLDRMANGGIYASLRQVLPNDYLNRLDGKIITLKDSETGEEYEAAIDLSKTGFLGDDSFEGYLVFAVAPPEDDFAASFLDYVIK